jgi:hypothetical protein
MDRGRVERFPRSAASPVNKKVNVFFSSGLYKNSRCNRGVTYKKSLLTMFSQQWQGLAEAQDKNGNRRRF